MKTQVLANPLISSENMQSSVMGMDANGADMATYYLRDKIYSDKILAVVREYCCNALDEHKKHGIDRAVNVGISEDGDVKTFFVRDYAKGLSENDIRNVFGMYFRSTKSGGNDQIGGFGIGSKAAHSYTDTFYVKSYHDGKCTLYACALGGGNSGVPVGHILKVSESPSDETGLEVSLEIKGRNDFNEFSLKIFDFISHNPQPITFIRLGEVFNPLVPEATFEKNGFKFRIFDCSSNYVGFSSYRNHHFCTLRIGMGGVYYINDAFYSFFSDIRKTAELKNNFQMIVDIPIGKMSLPISRENFESTKANKDVLEAVTKTVSEIIEEDLQSIAPMSLQELIDSQDEPKLFGKYFSTYKRNRYPKIYELIRHHMQCDKSKAIEKVNGKFVCALIPNKISSGYWCDKLKNHALKNGKNYLMLGESHFYKCDKEELDKNFFFKKVKSSFFNWPKESPRKECGSFSTPYSFKSKIGSYHWENNIGNALEIHNIARSSLNLTEAKTIEDAKKQMSDMKFTSLERLAHFSFCSKVSSEKEFGKFYFGSKTLRNLMKEIGWFEYDSPEQNALVKDLEAKQKEMNLRAQIIQSATLSFFEDSFKSKIGNKFNKNIKCAKKFLDIFEKIKNEDSIRSKIITILHRNSGYWGTAVRISREEFRKILKMK